MAIVEEYQSITDEISNLVIHVICVLKSNKLGQQKSVKKHTSKVGAVHVK